MLYHARALVVSYFSPGSPSAPGVRVAAIGRELRSRGLAVSIVCAVDASTQPTNLDLTLTEVSGLDALVTGWTTRSLDLLLRLFDGSCYRVRAPRGEGSAGPSDDSPTFSLTEHHAEVVGPLLRTCLRLASRLRPDLIVATAPPASIALVGAMLRKLLKIPLLLEYRDPWALYPDWTFDAFGRPRSLSPARLARLAAERAVDRRVMRTADKVILVGGPGFIDDYKGYAPDVPVRVVPNGYDAFLYRGIRAIRPARSTKILRWFGSYYDLHSPREFLNGLLMARHTGTLNSGMQVEFYAAGMPSWVGPFIRVHQLGELISIKVSVSYEDSVRLMCDADALLLTMASTSSLRSTVPAKLYMYLAAARPIVALVPTGFHVRELLAEHPIARVVDGSDPVAVAIAIAQVLGTVQPRINISAIAQHDRNRSLRPLGRLAEELVGIESEPQFSKRIKHRPVGGADRC